MLSLLVATSLCSQSKGLDPRAADRKGVRNVHLPNETAGFDQIVRTLLSVFNHADILALGESHWNKLDSDLRIRLVRHPDSARKVHFIVVEFGNTARQPVLDRYVRGEDVQFADLQQVWRNTTQTSGV